MSTESRSQATQTASFPITTLTPLQREVMIEYLRARKKSRLNVQEPVSVVRLLIGHKPGVDLAPLTMPSIVDYEPSISVKDVAEAFDLAYTTQGDRTIMARSSRMVDIYPSLGDNSATAARRAGTFLGYPSCDIEHFLHSGPPNTSPFTYIEKGAFSPEELAFTKFLPQRHEDSIEGYERSIAIGRDIYTLLAQSSQRWNLPELTEYLDWILESAIAKFEGNEFEYQWL